MARVYTAALVLAGCLVALPEDARAQRLQIFASAAAGTGVSLGTGGDGTAARRSATFVDLRVMGANSEMDWLRYGVSIRSELEGKVTIGVVPQLSIVTSWRQLLFGVTGGVPLIVMPKSLYGIEAGGHVGYQVLSWLAVTGLFYVSVFPLGNDLPEGSVLVMMQCHVGAEIRF